LRIKRKDTTLLLIVKRRGILLKEVKKDKWWGIPGSKYGDDK
jgi:hypothetical protein